MGRLVHFLSLGLIFMIPATAKADVSSEDKFLGNGDIIEAAIDSGRLVQAAEMLDAMKKASALREKSELEILAAELAIARQDEKQALSLFAKYLEHPEYLCRAKEGSGIALVRSGNWNIAIEYLADVTMKCPNRWKAWNMMGISLAHFGKFKASRHAFDTALGLSDNAPAVLNNLGYALMIQRDYTEARDIFELALIQQPKNDRFQNNLDIARAALGEGPEKSSAESHERWVERLNNSGYAALLTGHKESGTALLSRAVIGSSTMASRAAANLGWENFGATAP